MLEVVAAETETHYRQVRELMAELIAMDTAGMAELGINPRAALEFYYASGKEELPGVYAPPSGHMLLACDSGEAAGCGAFRRITSETCEMKRMYVRPEFRGKQIGRRLANTLILTAQEVGYGVMRLETTTYLNKAFALYSSLGFRPCPPYYNIPDSYRDITICMELRLAQSTASGMCSR